MRDGAVKLGGLGDMVAKEFMKAPAEHLVDVCLQQTRLTKPGLPVGSALTAGAAADRREQLDDLRAGAEDRSWQLLAEDEKIGDQPRLQPLLVQKAVGVARRDGVQNCGPLVAVERAADFL